VTAALLLVGCAAPEATDTDDVGGALILEQRGPSGLDDPRASYAVLGARGDGLAVTLLDAFGRPGLSVPAWIPRATGLTVHPDGYFILKADRALYSLDTSGSVDPFTDLDFPWLYGATAAADGTISVAAESEVVELDADGSLINRVPTGGTYCWMDTTVSADSQDDDETTVVDLWGSTLATVGRDDELNIVAHLPFDSIDISAQGTDGRHWFARTDGADIFAWDDVDGARWMAEIDLDGVEGIRGLMARPDGSVVAVAQTVSGVSAYHVAGDGTVTPAWSAPGELWLDVARVL